MMQHWVKSAVFLLNNEDHERNQSIIGNRKKLVNVMPSFSFRRILLPVWRNYRSVDLLAFEKR